MIFFLTRLLGDETMDDTGKALGTSGTKEKFIKGLLGNLMERDPFEHLDIDGRKILKTVYPRNSVIGCGHD
jgi:hypothetical protein